MLFPVDGRLVLIPLKVYVPISVLHTYMIHI